MDPASKPEPHENIATVVICISMSFYPLSDAFFGDTIEEVYNRDASLSIHKKKKEFSYFCVWPALPYCHQIHRGH